MPSYTKDSLLRESTYIGVPTSLISVFLKPITSYKQKKLATVEGKMESVSSWKMDKRKPSWN